MGNIAVGNASLFIMTEGGEPIPLGDTIEVEMITEDSSENNLKRDFMNLDMQKEVTFTAELDRSIDITRVLFGLTNNYRRLHGGYALRQRSIYRWYKKYGGKKCLQQMI